MTRFPMRFLLFSLVVGSGCASDYKALNRTTVDENCIQKLRPNGIMTSWYDASIEAAGKHISGLLLVKNMTDSSNRVVFTSEAGVTFLDFQFFNDGSFKVHRVIRQLDKKPVIRVLRKDFELMLGIPFRKMSWQTWETETEKYFGVMQNKETHYFITGLDCASLHRIESGSKRKRKVSLQYSGTDIRRPDSIRLLHHTFAMRIDLRKLARE